MYSGGALFTYLYMILYPSVVSSLKKQKERKNERNIMAEASLASSPLPPDIRSRIVKRQYAHDNVLQTYETYVPEGEDGTATEENGKVWIVYIVSARLAACLVP